uniref:Uncharacterized protein n=1 Tax=Arundo donax TaxID=35708 RepID=A0A0A9CEC8_ARUDO
MNSKRGSRLMGLRKASPSSRTISIFLKQ